MKLFLATHNKALMAEWQKLKRSGIFWICLGAVLFVPLINTLIYTFVSEPGFQEGTTWTGFLEQNLKGFTGFFFPLFLTIIIVRLVYMEYRSDTWKLLETQPVSKASLFLVKYEVALILSLFILFGLLLFALLGGLLLQWTKPQLQLSNHTIDWRTLMSALFRYWVAALGLLAIQYFLALLLKSFAWPLTIGLILIIAGSTVAGLGAISWFPYAATQRTSATFNGSLSGAWLVHHEALSILWALLFLWIGYRYFVSRSFQRAFFGNLRTSGTTAGVLLLFGFLFYTISKPTEQQRYGKTVLAGTISADKPVPFITVLQAATYDTICTTPLHQGRFHVVLPAPVANGKYLLVAGSQRLPFFWGANDSLHINWKQADGGTVVFGGTRVAENEYLKRGSSNFNYLAEYAYEFEPEAFLQRLTSAGDNAMRQLEKFTTADNIKPAADFRELERKLVAARLRNLADVVYPETFAIYHPNEVLRYPAGISRLRQAVSLSDSTLLSEDGYINFVSDYLALQARSAPDADSLFIRMSNDSLRGNIKELVLFRKIKSKVTVQTDSARQQAWLQAWLPQLRNEDYRRQLVHQVQQTANLQRGRKAFNFVSEALNGKEISLSNLAGRYVVIDVWATWCGPCKKESPFFEQLAERYTNPQVAFVSMSVDEDKNAWKMDAPRKSKRVLQLWAKNAQQDFFEQYLVATIPRFILIDPKGDILHAELPRPSDPEFEKVLASEIPFLSSY